jgi:hypothetical protein
MLARGYFSKSGADLLHVSRLEGAGAADFPRRDGMEPACVRGAASN